MADLEVVKFGSFAPVSDEQLADARDFRAAIEKWNAATPEQRAEWARQNELARAQKRAAVERVPLTLDALIGKMGWSREYAEHLIQPYCECYDGRDGWEYCQDARDEGLVG